MQLIFATAVLFRVHWRIYLFVVLLQVCHGPAVPMRQRSYGHTDGDCAWRAGDEWITMCPLS